MAKYYFRLIVLLSCIIGFLLLVFSLLPHSFSFDTEIEIAAPAEKVFPYLNDLQAWPRWNSQWDTEAISSLRIEYGKTQGEGAAQTWVDSRGQGKLWLTQSVPAERVEYRVEFLDAHEMDCQLELTPRAAGEQPTTMLTWKTQVKLPPGPFYGFFGWVLPGQMTYMQDLSLQKLKTICETESSSTASEEDASEEPAAAQE